MSNNDSMQQEQEGMENRIVHAIRNSFWHDDFRMLVVFLPGRENISVRMMDAADLGALLRNLQS